MRWTIKTKMLLSCLSFVLPVPGGCLMSPRLQLSRRLSSSFSFAPTSAAGATISAFELLRLKAQGSPVVALPYIPKNRFSDREGDEAKRVAYEHHDKVLNLPSPRKRTPETNIDDFYTRLLREKPLEADPVKDPNHRATRVITDDCDIALIVPFEKLSHLRLRFPSLKIRHFESTANFWSCSIPWDGDEVSLCQTRYKILCDTTADDELWSDKAGSAIVWAQPENADDQPTVDVIVNTVMFGRMGTICRLLSRRLWKGRVQDRIDFDFVEPGVRIASNPLESPLIVVVAPAIPCAEFCRGFDPVRLPDDATLAGSRPDSLGLEKLAEAEGLLESLRLSGSNWLQGEELYPTQFYSLVRYTAKEFEEDQDAATSEGRSVISCSADWVLKLLCETKQESILSGKVALVDARYCDVATLRLPENVYHVTLDCSSKAGFDKVYNKVGGASTVVFYCNHANTNSVRRAQDYQKFLLASGHANAKTQRVRVLEDGIGALLRMAAKKGGDPMLEQLFLRWEKEYTRHL